MTASVSLPIREQPSTQYRSYSTKRLCFVGFCPNLVRPTMTETEYATSNRNLNPFTPGGYFRLTAIVLALVGVLGIILFAIGQTRLLAFDSNTAHAGFLTLTLTHSIVHLILAAVAGLLGFGTVAPNVVKTMAIVIGAVYALLGIVGFFMVDPLGSSLSLQLGLGGNLVHVLLGGLGLVAGFRGD